MLSPLASRQQQSPIGTPYLGPITPNPQAKYTRGGSTAFSAADKANQYLELLYPLAFVNMKRANCLSLAQNVINIQYKAHGDPSPPSTKELAIMKTKVDRMIRKILFVFGQVKMNGSCIRSLFPSLNSRTSKFEQLYSYFQRTFTNLKREVIWEDVLVSLSTTVTPRTTCLSLTLHDLESLP